MTRKPIVHLLLAMLLMAIPTASVAADEEVITLPIRFHIAEGVVMHLKGQTMDMWVTTDDLKKVVIAEVNRIWKQANIRFTIERCRREPLRSPGNRAELIKIVENSKRGDAETKGTGRVASIDRLFDPSERHPTAQNVYLMPFIGSTYQGYARLSGTHVVVGVWTDKASKGKKPPVKVLLAEPEPMKVGSLARTIAHELGHNLGLSHPPKDLPDPTPRLMGGRIQGYGLTPEEIAKARDSARHHADPKSIR